MARLERVLGRQLVLGDNVDGGSAQRMAAFDHDSRAAQEYVRVGQHRRVVGAVQAGVGVGLDASLVVIAEGFGAVAENERVRVGRRDVSLERLERLGLASSPNQYIGASSNVPASSQSRLARSAEPVTSTTDCAALGRVGSMAVAGQADACVRPARLLPG
jgi:hypothetical protein